MRTLDVGGMAARFLRVARAKATASTRSPRSPPTARRPPHFRPDEVVDAPAATAPKTYLDYWNNDASARWEMIFAMLGAMFLWWTPPHRVGMADFKLRLRRIVIG